MIYIYAFDHEHQVGDLCSAATCEFARRAPVLSSDEVHRDIPMTILRQSNKREYESQSVPVDWTIPPLDYGCDFIYEVRIED